MMETSGDDDACIGHLWPMDHDDDSLKMFPQLFVAEQYMYQWKTGT